MKFSAATLFFTLLGGTLLADELPMLTEKPWLGTYLGYRDRGFDFSFNVKGGGQLFLMESKNRTNAKSYFKVSYILEEEVKSGKWVRRQMQRDGFTYTHEPSFELEESIITASYTGDTKVAIKHEFERGTVKIRAKIVEKTTENPLRFNVEVSVPEFWKNRDKNRPNPTEKQVEEEFDKRDAINDAHMRVVKLSDGKRVKFDFWEDLKLVEEIGAEGASEVYVDGDDQFGGRRVTIQTGNSDLIPLIATNRGKLYSGITVSWAAPEASLANPDNMLILQVK